jgi:hypothetical protein
MISFLKGQAYTLAQTDFRGGVATSGTIFAGSAVRLDPTTSNILLGSSTTTPVASSNQDLLGFSLNNDTDGDVLESGKIAAIGLDGNTVIETDQVSGGQSAITAANFPVGSKVTVNSSGVLVAAGSTDLVVGRVYGVRAFPGVATTATSSSGSIVGGGTSVAIQGPIQVLQVKLGSA